MRSDITSLEAKSMPTPNLASFFRRHCQRLAGSGPAGADLVFHDGSHKYGYKGWGNSVLFYIGVSLWLFSFSITKKTQKHHEEADMWPHSWDFFCAWGKWFVLMAEKGLFFFPYTIMLSPNYSAIIYKQRMMGNVLFLPPRNTHPKGIMNLVETCWVYCCAKTELPQSPNATWQAARQASGVINCWQASALQPGQAPCLIRTLSIKWQ